MRGGGGNAPLVAEPALGPTCGRTRGRHSPRKQGEKDEFSASPKNTPRLPPDRFAVATTSMNGDNSRVDWRT